MSEFDKTANEILKRLNENYINSADDAIQHHWAKTIEGHDEEEPADKKKKEDEEHDKKDEDEDEDEEELNSIREAYGLPKKRKGPHGEKPKLNCRSVHSL